MGKIHWVIKFILVHNHKIKFLISRLVVTIKNKLQFNEHKHEFKLTIKINQICIEIKTVQIYEISNNRKH